MTIELHANLLNTMANKLTSLLGKLTGQDTTLKDLQNTCKTISSDEVDLSDVITDIQNSSDNQGEQKKKLEKLKENIEDFIDKAEQVDNEVKDLINQRKDAFYKAHYNLKPYSEMGFWEKRWDNLKKVGEWCKEHWKLIVTIVLVIVAIVVLCIPGVNAILTELAVKTLIGVGIGGLIGGVTGEISGIGFWNGFEHGAFGGMLIGVTLGALGLPLKLGITAEVIYSFISGGGTRLFKNDDEFGFILRHPIAALSIGQATTGKGDTNISTNSTRFASAFGFKSDNGFGIADRKDEGSEVGAFRHTLWSALISNQFGDSIAIDANNSHEDNPNIIQDKDPYVHKFSNLKDADEAADILNNRIGRQISLNLSPDSSQKEITKVVLKYFYENGLNIVNKSEDGNYIVIKTKPSDSSLESSLKILNNLDNNGFPPGNKFYKGNDK